MNGVCGFGVRTLAHLFICSSPNPAEQGWRSGPRWVLLSHQGQLSRETGARGGGMERRKEDRLPGWEMRSRSIFPSSLSVMSSHFVRFCWWHTFSAHRPISRPGAGKKKKEGGGVCVRLEAAGLCVRVETERAHPPEGCQSWLLSNFPLPQDCERAGERPLRWAPLRFLSPPPPSVPAEVATSKALSVCNALEASSSWQPPLPPSTPASPPANQKRHIRMSRRTHTRAQTHTQKFTNQKVYFLEADSQEKSSWKKLE